VRENSKGTLDIEGCLQSNHRRAKLPPPSAAAASLRTAAGDCAGGTAKPRRAYPYLERDQQLKMPIPPSETKLAFTVKLPQA
jgi:hypothetical protein